MPQNYIFEFNGTKEAFFNKLDSYPNNTSYNGDKFYYFNDFIVKVIDNKIHFGVARGGHSGGYWFVPTITENDKCITFCGTVKYIGPNDDRGKIRKTIDCIGESLLFILILPIVLIIRLYMLFEWIIRKLFKKTKPKAKTTEEKLFDLMVNHLGCIRK